MEAVEVHCVGSVYNCQTCGKPPGRRRAVDAFVTGGLYPVAVLTLCLPCARRIGKAAEVKR